MHKRITSLTFAALSISFLQSCASYFPDYAFDEVIFDRHVEGDFERDWFSKQLKSLKEPSIYRKGCEFDECLRFTWLRSFHKPIAVRIEISDNGSATLYFKQTSGKGGYEPGQIEISRSSSLSADELKTIRQLVANLTEASAQPDDIIMLDGAEWILEFNDGTNYTAMSRQSPSNDAFSQLGIYLLQLRSFEGAQLNPLY